ncbi:MAG TPA: 6-carboxytetrahydropterin synthase [Chloroflexota bacterium]
MFEVGVVAHFEAAHRLRGAFGPATRLHGHTYRVEVRVAGEALQPDGTLCDLGALRQVVEEVVGTLRYRDLDEVELFAGQNTTAEVVARAIFEAVAMRLGGRGLSSARVQVWESPTAYAAYQGALA